MTVYDDRDYAAWLAGAMIPSDILKGLILRFRSAAEIYSLFVSSGEELREMLPAACFQLLVRNSRPEVLEHYHDVLRSLQIQTFMIGDALYPDYLTDLPDTPCILFYQGNPDCLAMPRRLSAVGSRKASYHGVRAARALTQELSRHQVCIISGLACGIDAACHQGCLEGGSPTAAVLGCGLDQQYPRANAALRQEIINAGGIVLSEYIPGEKPLGWHFPIRNRIISGLGQALVVMEARERSGSLTTVDWALRQGKDVFVYPGDPSLQLYNGGNYQLLRDGARFFAKAEHILEDMDWLDNPDQQAQNTTRFPDQAHMSPAEQKIVTLLSAGSLNMDEICIRTGMRVDEVMGALTMLQLQKVLEVLPGKYYRLIGS